MPISLGVWWCTKKGWCQPLAGRMLCIPFSVLTLLIGRLKGHSAHKKTCATYLQSSGCLLELVEEKPKRNQLTMFTWSGGKDNRLFDILYLVFFLKTKRCWYTCLILVLRLHALSYVHQICLQREKGAGTPCRCLQKYWLLLSLLLLILFGCITATGRCNLLLYMEKHGLLFCRSQTCALQK